MERLGGFGVPKEMLRVQHRMVPSLSAFPNEQFYDSLLTNGENTGIVVVLHVRKYQVRADSPHFLNRLYSLHSL